MNENELEKAIQRKIGELKSHFNLWGGQLSPLIVASLRRVAESDLDLERHEVLCAQINPGDAEYSYLLSERDRADRKYRLRLGALQKLLHTTIGNKELDLFDLASLFGWYQIRGKVYLHWKYILTHPLSWGFHPLPACSIKIKGEYFVPEDYIEKHNWKNSDWKMSEATLQRADKIQAKSDYEHLKPSEWRIDFEPESASTDQLQFDDQLPEPANAKKIKSVRNRLNYLSRKAVQAQS